MMLKLNSCDAVQMHVHKRAHTHIHTHVQMHACSKKETDSMHGHIHTQTCFLCCDAVVSFNIKLGLCEAVKDIKSALRGWGDSGALVKKGLVCLRVPATPLQS
eukprot:1033414-Pelagomonas_calceolata.AAC.8